MFSTRFSTMSQLSQLSQVETAVTVETLNSHSHLLLITLSSTYMWDVVSCIFLCLKLEVNTLYLSDKQ